MTDHTCPVTGADCLTCEPGACKLLHRRPLADRLRSHVQTMAVHGFVGGAGAWNRVSNDMLIAADMVSQVWHWQPIETAPRDGSRVDLWVDLGKSGAYRVSNARYTLPFGDHSMTCTWCEYKTDPDARHDMEWQEVRGTPTHWMPLPPPPTETDDD